MISRIFAALLGLGVLAGTASAQTCISLPYTLTNNTTADANQVMANFNYVLNCVNSQAASNLRGWLAGLTMSNDGTSPNTVIDTAAGIANSDDVTTLMTLAAFTKNANGAWAVGTGNGCLDSGSSLANSTWYHLFVIARTDTGVVDELCSTSAASPTLPTNYTKKRRIGSFKTDGSAHILAFSQYGDEFLWAAYVDNDGGANAGQISVTTALTMTLAAVPTGVKVQAILGGSYQAATDNGGYVSSLDTNDIAAGGTDSSSTWWTIVANKGHTMQLRVRTNSSAQFRFRSGVSGGATAVHFATLGWVDHRGKYD